METVIMNYTGKRMRRKKRKGSKMKRRRFKIRKLRHKRRTNPKIKKGGKSTMAKRRKRRSGKKRFSLKRMLKMTGRRKRRSRRSKGMAGITRSRRTRPVFYQIGKNVIKRSPKARHKYARVLNPLRFIQKNLGEMTSMLPDVVYTGAGYIGIGYVGQFITQTTGFKFMDNPMVRQLTKAGITIGLSTVANIWNKRAGKMVFLGGMLNVVQDVWNSYEVFKLVPINVPSLPAPASAPSESGASATETPASTIIDGSYDTLITNGGSPII